MMSTPTRCNYCVWSPEMVRVMWMNCSCCYVAVPQFLSELHDISFSGWTISVETCAPLTNQIRYGCMRNRVLPHTLWLSTVF